MRFKFIFCFACITLKLHSQCYRTNDVSYYGTAVAKTTNNVLLDNILNTEYSMLTKVFQVNLDFYILDDSEGSNAYFTSRCSGDKCDGSILLGTNLMSEEISKSSGPESIKAIMAHEFGHALQNLMGWGGIGKQKELHADFLAGYYIGLKSYIIRQNVDMFTKQFFSIGDNDFFSIYHHGTSKERACSFLEGYLCATTRNYNIYQAYNAGIDYINLNTPCNSFSPNRSYNTSVDPNTLPKGEICFRSIPNKTFGVFVDNDGRMIAEFSDDKPSPTIKNVVPGIYYFWIHKKALLSGYSDQVQPVAVNIKASSSTTFTIKSCTMFNISWHIDRVVKESYTDNYSEAKKWMSLGNYSNALSEINKAISSNPKDFNAIFVRALINGQLNNYNAALADYLEIIRNENNLTNPTFQMGTVYNNLGYSYLQMGESYYKQAKEYIDKACYMSPNESYIWGSLGEYYFKIGDYKNSIEKFNKSIQLIELKASKAPTMEGNGFSYYYRGLNKLKLNDKVGACNDFNKAKELNYKEAETYINSNCK